MAASACSGLPPIHRFIYSSHNGSHERYKYKWELEVAAWEKPLHHSTLPLLYRCKYTISHNGCGCQAEDHVDTGNCPYFQRTHVACDRDNPANRNRVTVTTQSRPGKCTKCLRREREYRELLAMQREQERHKAQDSAEARDRQRAAELHEKKIMEESLAEYNRVHRDQEEKDLQAALEASKEEEARRKRERESEDLKEGLARSREVNFQRSGFDSKDYSQRRRSGNHAPKYSADISEWTANVSREAGPAIPSPPPLPAGIVELSATIAQVDRWTISPKEDRHTPSRPSEPGLVPPAPPLPTGASKARPAPSLPQESAVPPSSHPTNEGKLKATDYSLPAYGNQDYDRFMVGGRRQPVHESQKLKESTNPKSVALPPAPAPHARLGSTIQPADIPTFTHMQENVSQAPRRPSFNAAPRKSSGSRPSAPCPIEPSADQELQAKLLRRRQWEVEEEAAASADSASPAASVSDASSAPGSPAVSRQTVERAIGVPRAPSGTLKNNMDDADIETATVIAPSRLDEKRRTGWK